MGARPARSHALALLFVVTGCENAIGVKPVEHDDGPTEVCLELDDSANGASVRSSCIGLTVERGVDLLFVIEDGRESAGLQRRWLDALDVLATRVEAMDPKPHLRVGFTTAHDGNPGCSASPVSRGELLLGSCRERPEDFVSADGTDRYDDLCANRCSLETFDPVALPGFEDLGSRPWIEIGSGFDNLPASVSLAQALQCAAPMGISGCHLPAPLSVTLDAHPRSWDDEEFMRFGSNPLVVTVTSGVDCSTSSLGAAAFDPDGDRTLWPDPTAAFPPLSTCWESGTLCAPRADGSLLCGPMDRDLDGAPSTPEDAVLRPMATVAERLDAALEIDRELNPAVEGRLYALTGVAPDAPERPPTYWPAETDEQAVELGVRPTCEVDGQSILPPVRTRVLEPTGWKIEHLSACADTLEPAMHRIADAIAELTPRHCFPACVRDMDEDEPGLQVDCRFDLVEPSPDGQPEERSLPRCEPGSGDEDVVPEGAPGCWTPRAGAEVPRNCYGFNLEVDFTWATVPSRNARVSPECKLSQDREVDCPDLP